MPFVALVTEAYKYILQLLSQPQRRTNIDYYFEIAVGNLESALRIRNINVESCNLEIVAAGEIQEVVSLLRCY
jgi:hypothetical protein